MFEPPPRNRNLTLLFLPVLLFCSCIPFSRDKQILVTTIPAQSSSPLIIKTTLKPILKDLTFQGFEKQTGQQRVRITVINLGEHNFSISLGTNHFSLITPNLPTEIFDEDVSKLTDWIWFQTVAEDSIPCEFRLEVSNPPKFLNDIKVYEYEKHVHF